VPLEPYQQELLEVAFGAASAMPVFPHIKNRSRAQEVVVLACLELDQSQLALRYVEQIDNWRRGAGYADLALYYAKHGAMKKDVESYLNRASELANKNDDWRGERIRLKIDRARSMSCAADSFDKRLSDADKLGSGKSFDALKTSLRAWTELYDGFYTDAERRTLVEERIRNSSAEMPVSVRVELLMRLAGFSLDHQDRAKARLLVDEARQMMDSARWQPRFGIPLRAGLAGLRFRAGDQERAHTEVHEALKMFDADRERIVNIYRAGILRSVAEAYQAMGETEKAREIYARATEAGIANPNSRPRAEDLTATCCSMAVHAVEPSEKLSRRIRQIRDNLGDPW
jgi:tetratricopeptide (TPR) repeat protein